MLAIGSIRKGKRVFYLVPTKALAEEKFNSLREAYRPLGIVTVISKMGFRGWSRTDIARLTREGYDTPEALSSLTIEILKRHLPEPLATRLYRHLHRETHEVATGEPILRRETTTVREPAPPYPASAETSVSPALLIDLSQQPITYEGIPVALSSYPFKLLTALARTPGRVVNKVVLYHALYGNADEASEDDRPYERQLADHKRKILDQIPKAAETEKQRQQLSSKLAKLIMVRRGVGYALNLNPADVSIIKEPALAE